MRDIRTRFALHWRMYWGSNMRLVTATVLTLAICLFTLTASAGSAKAQKRLALVIGNSTYQHTSKLDNPKNDAADMSAALKKLGFTVIDGIDLDKAGMERSLREFARALVGSDVGLLFYAGHGLQVNGQNYLVPIDAKLEDSSGLDFELLRIDLVQRTMERETRTNILFLDACRDNPLARNLARAMGTRSAAIGRGLAQIEAGGGTLISYSTQPGNVALDGTGRNSPFAGALVKHITAPGVDLRLSEAAEAWDRTKDSTNIAVLEAFLARYKDTVRFDLTINLRIARALGLSPQVALLQLADQVIE
jgi:uncharacterized caspase-like protein